MDTAVEFTRETLPFILTLFLGWLYANISKTGNPADISNRIKVNTAIVLGIFLGIALLFYEAPNLSAVYSYKIWVKYILTGFLVGTSAIGLNQLQKSRVKGVSEEKQKPADPPVAKP